MSTGIRIETKPGEVHIVAHALRKKLRVRVRPSYARALSLRLQEAAHEAETMGETADAEEAPWAALGRWLKGWRGDRG